MTAKTTIIVTRMSLGRPTRYRCDVAAQTVEVVGARGCPEHLRYRAIPVDSGTGFSVLLTAARKLGYRREYDTATHTATFVRA